MWIIRKQLRPIRLFADLYLKHKVSPEGSVTWSVLNSRKAFTTETLGIVIDLPLLVERFQTDNPDLKGKIGVAPIPAVKQTASFTGGKQRSDVLPVEEERPCLGLYEALTRTQASVSMG